MTAGKKTLNKHLHKKFKYKCILNAIPKALVIK